MRRRSRRIARWRAEVLVEIERPARVRQVPEFTVFDRLPDACFSEAGERHDDILSTRRLIANAAIYRSLRTVHRAVQHLRFTGN